jgi:hypothetical protein
MSFYDPTGRPKINVLPARAAMGGILPLVCPTDFDRHVVAVVPRVVSAIEKVAEIRVADRDRAQ